ncbi:anti-sigma factor antagonist [Streptomyces ipomoeae]|jgi:anti-anti-sigma regulatory factor|nr:STAS domain-containing protein [Streptomyces ipomoeae]MDX2695700.1 STAS domain-containing protein [Streptomyces ipomoeae]MDX2823527.1 STAS domain-containing protein [Streptomyces ipomoeae]MDX2842753.1 STAS domain-containing protein [Streptomyces ipomoeae]MDX2877282.1 STAS domain-containing protein [Streptomyces ipomoeae]MDX2936096.1 STAS domain-containing protein [Streptomyces ipomoeae]
MALLIYDLDGHRIVEVNEVVDIANADQFAGELATLIRESPERTVIVDLGCPLLTTAGVIFLERAHAVAARCGRVLRVTAGHRISRKVLRITGADHLLDVHPDLLTALDAT